MPDTIETSVLDDLEEAVGADFLVELIETFLAEAPGMMADLQAGHDSGDTDGLRCAAHSLKSNASTFGAPILAEAARQIEVGGVGASPDTTLGAVADALDAASVALRERINA